jgi:hypothetical protein
MFFKWDFFNASKSLPGHVGKSNYFAKRGKVGEAKKGGGGVHLIKDPPLPRNIVFKAPSLKE